MNFTFGLGTNVVYRGLNATAFYTIRPMFYGRPIYYPIQNAITYTSVLASISNPRLKITEGKTKIITQLEQDPATVVITSKDDITAFDGKKHDMLCSKAEYSTGTTCHVFQLLKKQGVPVAFYQQLDAIRFTAPKCDMIFYEVVIRRQAHGSYLKRNPELEKGHVFPDLILEFFLKTKDQEWKGAKLVSDDPYVLFKEGKAELYDPKCPVVKPFMVLEDYPLKGREEYFTKMGDIAKKTFLILERAWQLQGSILVDFKVEFGFDTKGNLLLADVIDNDSWRVVHNGEYIDKQFYRDGGNLSDVEKKYRYVRDCTAKFNQS